LKILVFSGIKSYFEKNSCFSEKEFFSKKVAFCKILYFFCK